MTKPRFAAFDVDQTMYRWSLFLELIDIMVDSGLMARSVRDGASEARRKWENREGTYNAYVEKQVELFVDGALRGCRESDVIRVSHELLRRKQKRQYLFTRELLGALRDCGYKTLAISGSPTQVVRVFAEHWGFTDWIGTEFEVDAHGVLTGDDTKTIRHFLHKDALFDETRERLGCTAEGSLAIADSFYDLPMLRRARHPIAFNPERELEESARVEKIPVVKERASVVTILRSGLIANPSPIGELGLVEVRARFILPPDVAERLRSRLSDVGVALR